VSAFSDAELAYLSERRLGRLATVGADGVPHVVPLGWTYNARLDTIDVGGRDFAETQKFKNVARDGKVAIVIDDVLPPWRPRFVLVQGTGEALDNATAADGSPTGPIIRIHPTRVISRGLDQKP
jgi:pyridoxamine 5'-phosphate oxidase family protein